jgi:pilus assembly protein CpaF
VVSLDGVAAAVRRRFVDGDAPVSDPIATLYQLVLDEAPLLEPRVARRLARDLAVELTGLGSIQGLLDDPAVTDVLVNGAGPVWVERRGRLERSGVTVDDAQIRTAIERLVAPLGLRADRAHPVVDARLPDGTRVTVVLDPLAIDGPVLALRRHRAVQLPLAEIAGAFRGVLEDRLAARRNVVVYGATGSGKTTLLNALGATLLPTERVVTIEDVAELRFPGGHVVRLEARPGTADGVGRVGMRDLVRAALRLRPDRLVIGEVRGAEALDMLWALSTGHLGSMSTLHAATASDALARLETMALASDDGIPIDVVRAQIHSSVHVLVGMRRASDGRRSVHAVHDLIDAALIDVASDSVLGMRS